MKKYTLILTTVLSGTVGLNTSLSGQVYDPSQGGGSSSTPNPQPAQNNTTIINKKEKSSSPYGNEVPFVDPTQETVTIMGHTFKVGDNRLGGQFEAYLADDPNLSQEAQEYRDTIDTILKTVSPHTKGKISQKLRDGFALLPRAASYPGDGRICDSLSNTIYAAMLAKGAIRNSKDYITNLEKERKRLVYNADVISKKGVLGQPSPTGSNNQTTVQNGGRNRNSANTNPISSSNKSPEVQEIERRLIEIEALKKLHQAKDEINLVQTKIQYQALLAQLFMQRRFEHVVIGTRFYNLIFRDGDSKMRLKKGSDVAKFFGEGIGVDPTVTGLDSAANEAISKVNSLVNAFQNHLKHNELHSASKRMTEAYAVGEFMPRVQTVPASDRRKILEYVRDGNALVKTMSVRDYASSKKLIDALKKRASDFDSTKAEGAIAAYTRVSDAHVRAAKIALMKNDEAKFNAEIAKATSIWPTNPKLEEIDELLDKAIADGSTGNKLLNDFDRLLSENNFREIFKRQYEFMPVVHKDQKRRNAIEQIIRNITRIDTTIQLAKQASLGGNDFAAWEALASLRDEFPKDPELLQRLEKLSSRVADFTVALAKAKEFEDNEFNPQTGSALTWYMEAKRIYPDSKHAQKGIDRLVQRIVPTSNGINNATSAKANSDDDF